MLKQFFQIFVTLLIVIDPIGIVPLFISATGQLPLEKRNKIIKQAIQIAAAVMIVFIVAGRFLLSLMGITVGAFYLAGGAMFFLIAIDMLFGQPKRAKTSNEEMLEDYASIAVFPLAIPMISGPGTITTLMMFSANITSYPLSIIMLVGAIIPILVLAYVAMKSSGLILKVLGKTGVSVIERIMGLILSGLAVQFILEGLHKTGILISP
ncbi:MAG TPA: MarC family protein [Spirochaetia bacterium]|nr:MarC family protein [Spirochaetales bacterium]HRS65798.1 MarC family protein [Spirochaetia bacterium]HOT59171.1 MarC family protein [Spirochaetales bacterium]HPD81286.1 MarC family protein [Spirochaetales bacterium]HQK34013.1 MarC family protein [Spirochaetales bacterium]